MCGGWQGTHIKRHKPSKPAAVPGTGGPFRPVDFLVGGSFQLYDRTFHLVDADSYTRWAAHMPSLLSLQQARQSARHLENREIRELSGNGISWSGTSLPVLDCSKPISGAY